MSIKSQSITSPPVLRSYVTGVAALAIAALSQGGWIEPSGVATFWNVVGALIALGVLSSAFSVRARIGTNAVSFVPYLASIILVGPSWGMLVAGVSEFASDTVFLRKPLIRAVHNTAKEILGVGVAGYVYVSLGGTYGTSAFPSISPAVFPGFVAAVVVYFTVSNGASATAVALSTRQDILECWRELVWKSFAYNVLSASLSVLLAVLYIELDLAGLLLVIIPLFFLRHAHAVNYKLEEASRDLLELMVKSIEARDPYTSGHSLRVSRMARLLARDLGIPSREVEQIETAALLHDVGKIYEEYAPILRKEAKLTSEERALMETHPVKSAELVATISSLRGYVERCVRYHHENWDGGGYPDGLLDEEIPLGARIIMLADTADAMMTDRPYRRALSYDRVIAEFDKFAGTQFDPDLVVAFKKSMPIRRYIDQRTSEVVPDATGRVSEPVRAGTLQITSRSLPFV